MLQPGFRSAPITKTLFITLGLTSLLVSLADLKPLFHIQAHPHILTHGQWWRCLVWQLGGYMNAGELLFGAMLVYCLRVQERVWGSGKYLSFILYNLLLTTVVPPLIMFLLRPLTGQNYIPPGPTPLLFALLSQYHHSIPQVYKYRLGSDSTASPTGSASWEETFSLVLSDKLYIYILATQLALSQPWGSVFAAGVGWVCGRVWREEWVPGCGWRVPRGFVGGGEVEGLRRRLDAGRR
ncbi:hypothetical protein BJ508DRAFT_243891 [Ascobolus immersus RN42]|uniref:Peptidase S54 rhomboid domain-containing protein n=1 Tax=Ascobolus immersus RN42 TaxID=1160509 RepID=A0A3N4HRI2_ASCIM|nr:hypothetical protein BJ508DRAFT_243891 [Ascobolus immersus RN42]